jgi:transcriptional regulator with XRE-family HTH domain
LIACIYFAKKFGLIRQEHNMTTYAAFPDVSIPRYLAHDVAEIKRLARQGKAVVLTPRLIALFVKQQRAMLGWKQNTLASFANVSLSTVERIERAEAVSVTSLDRVAVAFGQQPGAFTEPRHLLSGTELEQKVRDSIAVFKDKVWVPVRPLRTQPQVSSLARTHIKEVDRTRLGDEFITDCELLVDTIDVIGCSLMMEDRGTFVDTARLKRRELYAVVLDQVRLIEKRAHAVALAGVYKAPTNCCTLREVDVGMVVFFPLSSDPGAVKRTRLLAPDRIDLIESWHRFLGRTCSQI